MAGHDEYIKLDTNPVESIIGLGDGDLMAGIRKARKLAKSLGSNRVGNTLVATATQTVAAGATTAEITLKFHQPVKPNLIYYKNSATDTGKLTGIKVNGKPIEYAYGYTVLQGTGTASLTMIELAGIEDCDLCEIWGTGCEVTFQFSTCVAADVITLAVVCWDLNWDVS